MGELLFALASLIVIVPIIWFVPLGLTAKGKGIVIVASFISASVGMFAKMSFSTIYTIVLMLLLVILFAILIESRFKGLLFMQNESYSLDTFLKDDLTAKDEHVDIKGETKSEYEKTAVKEAAHLPSAPAEQVHLSKMESSSELVGTLPSAVIDRLSAQDEGQFVSNFAVKIVEVEQNAENKVEEVALEKQANDNGLRTEMAGEQPILLEEYEEMFDEDTSFLLNREQLLTETKNDVDLMEQEVPKGFMTEIEQLLDDEKFESTSDTMGLLNEQAISDTSPQQEAAAAMENGADHESSELTVLQFDSIKAESQERDTEEEQPILWEEDVIEPIKPFKADGSKGG